MPLTPIFDPHEMKRPMRVAAFMSGSGTNIIKLIEHEKNLSAREDGSPYKVIFIFSDRSDDASAGEKIALDNGLPYFSYDIRSYHQMRSIKRTVNTSEGLEARRDYDSVAKTLVTAFNIDVIALGGYMSYTTLNRCVNVHPADLSIHLPDGRRKFVGDNAVYDAILAGEKTLKASTLWTDEGVDTGPLLMVSVPLTVELPKPVGIPAKTHEELIPTIDEHQERLKETGDWKILPRTIEMIARGRFAFDEKKRVYVDGRSTPGGYRE